MTVSDEARELARKAKAELIRRGRHVGSYSADTDESDTCRVCILGAVAAATGRNPHWGPGESGASGELVTVLAERTRPRPAGFVEAFEAYNWEDDWEADIDAVANWHDDPTTTDDDVYRLLDDIAGDSLSEPSELAVQGAT